MAVERFLVIKMVELGLRAKHSLSRSEQYLLYEHESWNGRACPSICVNACERRTACFSKHHVNSTTSSCADHSVGLPFYPQGEVLLRVAHGWRRQVKVSKDSGLFSTLDSMKGFVDSMVGSPCLK
jgi:hypothetical protein